MNDFVQCEQSDRIVTLTLNRPEARNALSSGMCDKLVESITRADNDTSVRCIILTGAGTAFCSGGDIKSMSQDAAKAADKGPGATRTKYKRGIHRMVLAFSEIETPTIAAINGPAIGAGCDLACLCDIRVASENAIIAASFVKLGLVPGDGGAWLLPRIIGFPNAAELILTGDMIDAQKAMSIGLVSRVVPHAQLLSTATALARRIVAHPQLALRLSKRLLHESQHARLTDILELSAALQAIVQEDISHVEAVQAFLSKRRSPSIDK